MRITAKRIVLGLIVGALVAALIAPAVALAVPGRSSAPAASRSTSATVTDSRAQGLEQRIMNALRNRAKRFENYASMLERHRERLLVLCDKVEAAGVDCAQVREQIQLSVQTMEQAREQEQIAEAMFKDITGASDKGASFKQAREQARVAVRTLKQSRDQLKVATRTLQGLVEELLDEIAETESE